MVRAPVYGPPEASQEVPDVPKRSKVSKRATGGYARKNSTPKGSNAKSTAKRLKKNGV